MFKDFRERNAISKEQYETSYNGLISKMGITEKELHDCILSRRMR